MPRPSPAAGPSRSDLQTLYSMWGVAVKLFELDRASKAWPILDECLTRAAALPPSQRNVFSGLANVGINDARKAGDADACRRTAELWEKLGPTGPEGLYHAARYRAITAEVTLVKDPSPEGRRRAGDDADRAMDWLRKAVDAGFDEADVLKQSTSFRAIQDRPDFRDLSARLGSRPK